MPRNDDDEKNTLGAFPLHRVVRGSATHDQIEREADSSTEGFQRQDFALYCVARQTTFSPLLNHPRILREGSGLSSSVTGSNFQDAEDDFASLASTASTASTASAVSLSMPALNDWCGERGRTNTEVVGCATSMEAGPTFSWERGQGAPEPGPFQTSCQGSRRQQRSHPYRRVQRASSPVQDLGDDNFCDDSELTLGPGKPTNISCGAK